MSNSKDSYWVLQLVLIGVIIVCIIWIITTQLSPLSEYLLLKQTGVSVNGTVLSHNAESRHYKNGTPYEDYYIKYQYVVQNPKGNAPFIETEQVPSDTYNLYPVDAAIGVLYLADNPGIHMLTPNSFTYAPVLSDFLWEIAAIIVSSIGIYALSRRKRS